MRLFILTLLLITLLYSSCTIEKMRYSKGYNIEWLSNKQVKNTKKKPQKAAEIRFVKNYESSEFIDSNNVIIKEVLIEDASSIIQNIPINKGISPEIFKRKATNKKESCLTEKKQSNTQGNNHTKFRKTELHPVVEGLFYFFILGPAISVLAVFTLLYGQPHIAIFLFIIGGVVSIYGIAKILSFLITELFG